MNILELMLVWSAIYIAKVICDKQILHWSAIYIAKVVCDKQILHWSAIYIAKVICDNQILHWSAIYIAKVICDKQILLWSAIYIAKVICDNQILLCPVGWGCRIHRLILCRGVRAPHNECSGYDTKESDYEGPAMLELRGMRNTPLLPSLPGSLWPGVAAPDIYGLNRTKLHFFSLYWFLHLNCVFMRNWIV